MPTDALPFRRTHTDDLLPYHRVFTDALGRPLAGSVTFTPRAPVQAGNVVIPLAPAKADLGPGGALDVFLPPGAYEVVAQLRTPEGVGVMFKDRVILEEPS